MAIKGGNQQGVGVVAVAEDGEENSWEINDELIGLIAGHRQERGTEIIRVNEERRSKEED